MDRWLVAAAYYIVCSRWHGGQNSHGYKKLSQLKRMRFRPGMASWEKDKSSPERNEAALLLWKNRQNIRRFW